MATTERFDPVAFKEQQRGEWQSAAAGWEAWRHVLDAEAAGGAQTRTLLELARIGPGDAVLDVATGYGEPGLSAARAVAPGGRVVLTDLAADMLAYARKRAEAMDLGDVEVELVEADAEDLAFEDESFDAITCRHGLQFLADVAGTLRRYHRFLKPGGRLAAVVWGPPPTVKFSLAIPVILKELELPPPPAGRPGIFALADAAALATLVEGAGFRDVETGTLPVVYETDGPEQWTRLIRDISPPITRLVDGRPPEVQERVWAKVTEAWAPFTSPDGRTRIDCRAIWVAGTR